MATFANTLSPTPFGFFDSDAAFQTEADAMVTFVKRKLGDDILSVELTKKQIWACFEEATLEYSSIINEHQAKNSLANILGFSTSSLEGAEKLYQRENLEFFLRQAEPYAMDAGIGGSYNTYSGSIQLTRGQQDYDIYTDLKNDAGTPLVDLPQNSPKSKLKVFEVFHFSPQAAYRFFDTTSAINYLNNEFAFESFTPETVFYVLPVFEDILRGGQLDLSSRVRRSNYSYRISGTKIRIYPTPVQTSPQKLWMRVGFSPNPFSADYTDESIGGVNNLNNAPFGRLDYASMNSIGRQWIRQFTLALAREVLGLVRSKFSSVPIPDGDVNLNGSDLVTSGRGDQERLREKLRETLDQLTYGNLIDEAAAARESLTQVLRRIPIPIGKAITIG
jgi:hypothetical protein